MSHAKEQHEQIQDWTIKENAQSISICWTGKVITQILLRRTPRDEALANARYIVNACNYYHKVGLKALGIRIDDERTL